MDLTIQIALAGFSIAVLFVMRSQMRSVAALEWWLRATYAALFAEVCGRLAAGRVLPGIDTFLYFSAFVAGLFVIGFFVAGVIKLEFCISRMTRMLVAGASVAILISLFVGRFANPPETLSQALAGTYHALFPLLCMMAGAYVWRRGAKHRHFASSLSIIQCLPAFIVAMHRLFSMDWSAGPLYESVAGFFASLAGSMDAVSLMLTTIAFAYLAIEEADRNLNAIQASSSSMRQLLDSGVDGICELDPEGHLRTVNAPAAVILGVDVANPGSKSIHDLLEPWRGPESESALSSLLLRPSAPVKDAVARIRTSESSFTVVEWSTSPIINNGQLTGTVMTLRDVTHQDVNDQYRAKRFEVLEMMARNRAVDEIMRVICGMVELRHPGYRFCVLQCGPEFFRVAAAPSLAEDYRNAMNQIPCVRSFRAYEVIADPDQMWNTTLRNTAATFGYNGTWTAPMISSAHELLGHVVLNSYVGNTLPNEIRETMTDAAHLAALAVEHRCSFERLLHQGHHDTLTGLPNRLLLADRLNQALARAGRTQTQMALMCIDLDRFKYINDTLGHDAGDQFLQQISVRLQARIRLSDTLARTGGDEFTVILGDVQDPRDAVRVAESLIASLREPFHIDDHTLYGSATIGIAFYPFDGRDAESLHRNADRAMYRGKALGRNSVQCYSEADTADDNDRIEIDSHLRRAIDDGNFQIHFQPQFNCDRKLSGFEALLRFNHPTLGIVPPSRFIPMAEESGLVLPIGNWVLHEVCRQIAEWQSKGLKPVHVAVNVSPLQFAQADFANTVAQALKTHNVRPDLLELELTEGVLMTCVHDSKLQMEAIAQIGVRISVDDFGTGYSSLSYLHQLPIQVLKIDRSFISKMLEPDGTQCIVDAIISLAHRLGLKTVAEGVEEYEQLELLRAAGCDLIQGFLFSHPLPADDASALLYQQGGLDSAPPMLEEAATLRTRAPRLAAVPAPRRRRV